MYKCQVCLYFSGYDKLKPYGFSIHGAICGYSRRILWMEVVRSNKNPSVIAEIFLNCVKEVFTIVWDRKCSTVCNAMLPKG